MKEGQGFSLASGAGHPAASHRGMRGTVRLHFWGVRQGTEGTAHSAALGVQDGKYVPIVASKESLNVSGKTERKEKGGEKKARHVPTAPSPLRVKALWLHPPGHGTWSAREPRQQLSARKGDNGLNWGRGCGPPEAGKYAGRRRRKPPEPGPRHHNLGTGIHCWQEASM